jgi:hypothetical protein
VSDRNELLAAVQDRLLAKDPRALVLAEDAKRDAEALASGCAPDTEVTWTLGQFYWARYHLRPGPQNDEIITALNYFDDLYAAGPENGAELVPDAFRVALGEEDSAVFGSSPAADKLQDAALDLIRMYDYLPEPVLVEHAISLLDKAATAAPDHSFERFTVLEDLARVLLQYHEITGNAGWLAAIARVAREVIAMAHGGRLAPTYLSEFASTFGRLYLQAEDTGLLASFIDACREAVTAPADDDPHRSGRLNNLCLELRRLFLRFGDPALLAESVRAGRAAVAAAAGGDPELARCLHNLGTALMSEYERAGEADVIAEAASVMRRAVAVSATEDPGRAERLSVLGAVLHTLSQRTGDPDLLSEAVRVGREAVASTPTADPHRAGHLGNLGVGLQSLFESTGDSSLLTEAIEVKRAAVAATPEAGPGRARSLTNLGLALQRAADRTGDAGLLAEAVAVQREAVAAARDDPSDRGLCLSNLASVLTTRYRRTGDTAALAEAVQAGRDAAPMTASGGTNRAVHLNHLANALSELYERTGEPALLEEAVQSSREALASIPPGHADRALYLDNLGGQLQALFRKTGEMAPLREAVLARAEAVAVCPEGHPSRAECLSNLGGAMLILYGRSEEIEVEGVTQLLDDAVQALREAVAATPGDHSDRAARLNNLGVALRAQYEVNSQAETLAEAVQAAREATAATSADHIDLASRLNNLGTMLRAMAERSGSHAELEEAVRATREAVQHTSEDHPLHASYLCDLALTLDALSALTGRPEPRAEARDCMSRAAADTAAPPKTRITACQHLARLFGGEPSAALRALQTAVELTELVDLGGFTLQDRFVMVRGLSGLAGEAAGGGMSAAKTEQAVELAERARGILVADTLHARGSDNARLREAAPQIADELAALRARLDARQDRLLPVGTLDDESTAEAQAQRRLAADRRDAYTAWRRLVGRIRELPGFADFYSPPKFADLSGQAADGPVVIVTTSDTRSDALILTGDPGQPLRPVPLPSVSRGAAHNQASRLHAACLNLAESVPGSDPYAAAEAQIRVVLAWLWDAVAEPVLGAIGRTSTPRQDVWPRLWWCPTGALAALPLHAAGYHGDLADPARRANPRTVLDRIVSSYTTTVRALAYARSHQPDPAQAALIVAPGNPEEGGSLPATIIEAERIADLLPAARLLDRPTPGSVLAALPTHQIVHFACHAHADWGDPARSYLQLDGADLPVPDIGALRLNSALAFLAACDTAVSPPMLSDESAHIASAFNLAGYQHVISSLWWVNDSVASRLAEDFYTQLTLGGTSPPETRGCAHALHHAVRRLRTRFRDHPAMWAGYFHTGP